MIEISYELVMVYYLFIELGGDSSEKQTESLTGFFHQLTGGNKRISMRFFVPVGH
jgi:hypothetical protein